LYYCYIVYKVVANIKNYRFKHQESREIMKSSQFLISHRFYYVLTLYVWYNQSIFYIF